MYWLIIKRRFFKLTVEGGAKNVSGLMEEIQTMKDSWLKLFEEANQVTSNLSINVELNRGSMIQKKKQFFNDTGCRLQFYFWIPRYLFQDTGVHPDLEFASIRVKGTEQKNGLSFKIVHLFSVYQMTWMNLL